VWALGARVGHQPRPGPALMPCAGFCSGLESGANPHERHPWLYIARTCHVQHQSHHHQTPPAAACCPQAPAERERARNIERNQEQLRAIFGSSVGGGAAVGEEAAAAAPTPKKKGGGGRGGSSKAGGMKKRKV